MNNSLIRKARQFLRIIKNINHHPLSGRHRLLGYYRFLNWQLRSRIRAGRLVVPFTAKSRLFVRKGMTGATGNIYMGLHDFAEMAFLLHFLREEDLFMDVGANVGTYTVLASAHAGCRTLAFEPVLVTFALLRENLALNGLSERVRSFACAVGSKAGTLLITQSLDTVNHVVGRRGPNCADILEVAVVTIDEKVAAEGCPLLVKIDVEGYETEVLRGMAETLVHPQCKALIIELNSSGARYGYRDEEIHRLLLDHGFHPFAYNPYQRTLEPIPCYGPFNTLYLRDLAFITARLKSGAPVTIFNETF